MRTVIATCPLCEATCGIVAEVEADRLVAVRGDPDDPFSQGYVCPKGAALPDLQHDPDRLTRPLKRTADGSFVEASWEEAYAAIGAPDQLLLSAEPASESKLLHWILARAKP